MKLGGLAMRFKLLATDLDGTLLKNDKCIDSETIEYIIKFQKNGGKLVLITGRRISEIWDYINCLKVLDYKSGYVVTCDGQYIWDIGKNKKIANEYLNSQDIVYLLGLSIINKFIISLYDEHNDFLIFKKQRILKYIILYLYYKVVKKNNRIKFISRRKAVELFKTNNIEKISLKSITLNSNISSFFQNLLNGLHDYNITLIENKRIEISKKNVNKCQALKEIMKWNHFCNDDIVVFGDEGNDIGMLQYFNNSFAMGNASNHVKQSAKFITDTNENQGVLKIMKKYISKC